MSNKGTLVIAKLDPATDEVQIMLEASSVSLYDLKVIAEEWIYDSKYRGLVIHWVWISNIIALVPKLVQTIDTAIIVGTIDEEANFQISIVR